MKGLSVILYKKILTKFRFSQRCISRKLDIPPSSHAKIYMEFFDVVWSARFSLNHSRSFACVLCERPLTKLSTLSIVVFKAPKLFGHFISSRIKITSSDVRSSFSTSCSIFPRRCFPIKTSCDWIPVYDGSDQGLVNAKCFVFLTTTWLFLCRCLSAQKNLFHWLSLILTFSCMSLSMFTIEPKYVNGWTTSKLYSSIAMFWRMPVLCFLSNVRYLVLSSLTLRMRLTLLLCPFRQVFSFSLPILVLTNPRHLQRLLVALACWKWCNSSWLSLQPSPDGDQTGLLRAALCYAPIIQLSRAQT